jgi:alkylation response protein AidB-like acyl-CoA dehydrogenase
MSVAATDVATIGSEARAWLAEHWRPERPLGEWWQVLAESGWGYPSYPAEWFGRGLPPEADAIVDREFRTMGAFGPPRGIATMMVAPLLLELGTDEQRRRWLPGILTGREIWCQLFSEPGAGSDLAAASTKANLDGDEWIVNGQKVWTSGGHYADWAILVARTDPSVPKHRGLSFFVIAMDQPGVEPRPLVQMTGDAEFNEVFLTDAVVPTDQLIGEVGHGWGIALRLLSHERNSLDPEEDAGIQTALDLSQPVGRYASGELADGTEGYMPKASVAWSMLIELLRATGAADDAVVRQEAMRLYSGFEIARVAAGRAAAAAASGRLPGPEVSLGKLRSVGLMRRYRDLTLGVLGAAGALAGDDAPYDGRFAQLALSVSGMSIAGGTDEIQRNIVGERVLGLPGEPRVDKDIPFADVPR